MPILTRVQPIAYTPRKSMPRAITDDLQRSIFTVVQCLQHDLQPGGAHAAVREGAYAAVRCGLLDATV